MSHLLRDVRRSAAFGRPVIFNLRFLQGHLHHRSTGDSGRSCKNTKSPHGRYWSRRRRLCVQVGAVYATNCVATAGCDNVVELGNQQLLIGENDAVRYTIVRLQRATSKSVATTFPISYAF